MNNNKEYFKRTFFGFLLGVVIIIGVFSIFAFSISSNHGFNYLLVSLSLPIILYGLSMPANFNYFFYKNDNVNLHRFIHTFAIRGIDYKVPLRTYIERISILFYMGYLLLLNVVVYLVAMFSSNIELVYIDNFDKIYYLLLYTPGLIILLFEVSMIIIEEILYNIKPQIRAK